MTRCTLFFAVFLSLFLLCSCDRSVQSTELGQPEKLLEKPCSSTNCSSLLIPQDSKGDKSMIKVEFERVYYKQKENEIAKKSESWMSGFLKTFLMIISMEIGDKTFFIGAILAMSHNRWLVFIGSVSALVVMCVISCIIGLSAPILMSREVTVVVAAVLFVFFGVRMILEGLQTREQDVSGEYAEAEESIKKHITDKDNIHSDAEVGLISKKDDDATVDEFRCDLNNIVLRTFIMVFFAEWGDRSQFSTLLLAGTHPVSSVVAGATCGYIVATLCGILGGNFFARIISPKIVAIAGGILFILFAVQIVIFKD